MIEVRDGVAYIGDIPIQATPAEVARMRERDTAEREAAARAAVEKAIADRALIRRAIADPGQFTGRQFGATSPHPEPHEPLIEWQARAVQIALRGGERRK